MNKFENVYQDAALMRKVLLGEANEVERHLDIHFRTYSS